MDFDGYTLYFPRTSWMYVRTSTPSNVCEMYIDSLSFSFITPSILLGDSFLRNYYILHDAANERVGFYGTYKESGMMSEVNYILLAAS